MIEQASKQPPTAITDRGEGQAFDVDAKHCVFRCAGSWFSLPATAVRELRLAPEPVPVPGSHAALAGLCHARSEFMPVLRLNVLLDDGPPKDHEDQKLLVLTGSAGHWALLITEVVALEALETLVDPNVPVIGRPSAAVRGTASYGDQIVRVIDPGALQRHIQETLDSCWNNLVPSLSEPDETVGGQQ